VLDQGQALLTKGRYAAVVDVPFLLGPVVSAPLLKRELEKKGFRNVGVFEEKPARFPLQGSGDYYVTVDWVNSPQVFDVPSAVTEYRKVA
jgi:hypothetical protein